MKKVPFVTLDKLQEITAQFPTPFHLYDEKGIRENAKAVKEAFAWNKGFKEFFAVKATPNPFLIQILQEYGCGCDCSSMTELMMSKAIGCKEGDIMFSSNDTPEEEFKYANEIGGIINLDDITHIEYLEKNHGSLPDTFCVRYNPGSLKEGGNTIIGLPEEAKYGMTREQIFEAYKQLQAKGVKHFGIHTMVVSNELDIDGLVGTAELCFNLAVDIKKELGITIEFIDLGGGVGVAYKPEQTPVDFRVLSKGVEEAYNRILVANGLNDVALAYECGRMVTGPFGYLVSTAIHKKDIYRHYIGLDACMANLMRPALYGSYHHITVMGKENAPKDHVYDVTGSLCENNDKFAIQRELPKIDIGDCVIIHDAGAHGHSMGFNYNGKLRSAELLLHKDGSVTQIRRAETYDDLFGTLDFSNL